MLHKTLSSHTLSSTRIHNSVTKDDQHSTSFLFSFKLVTVLL